MSYVINFLCIFDILAMIIILNLGLFAKFYPYFYLKQYRKKHDRKYFPSLSIFIPCKGAGKYFESNVRSFLQLNHEKIRVFFIVEDKSDPAYKIISNVIQTQSGFSIVIAGQAKNCGQKNHNLLSGIAASGEKDEIYIFLDSDILFGLKDIRKLIAPLSRPEISATSGFQWNVLSAGSINEKLLSFLIAVQRSTMKLPFFSNVWGGATAIRRKDFENIGVKEYWSRTVVDDMSLDKLLIKNTRKTVFVPFCISESVRKADSFLNTIIWFKRQLQFVKYYMPLSWILLSYVLLYQLFNYFIILPLIVLNLAIHKTPFVIALATVGLAINFNFIYSYLIKRTTKDNSNIFSWLILSPLFISAASISVLLSLFTKDIHWCNIKYSIGKNGVVENIIRQ